MKKTINTIATFTLALLLFSFTSAKSSHFIGTYNVSANDPSQIKLIISSDNTFYYQDHSVSDQKIVVRGNWTLKRNKVVLQGNEKNQKFHDVWNFDKNGKIAKSRKGLTFYRLVKAD